MILEGIKSSAHIVSDINFIEFTSSTLGLYAVLVEKKMVPKGSAQLEGVGFLD